MDYLCRSARQTIDFLCRRCEIFIVQPMEAGVTEFMKCVVFGCALWLGVALVRGVTFMLTDAMHMLR